MPDKIAFIAARTEDARIAADRLARRYGGCAPEDAEVIVALGGDGTLLQTLHDTLELSAPVYGMNRGSVGFMLNPYNEDNLLRRLSEAKAIEIHPLRMVAADCQGKTIEAIAFNEVSLLREARQAAKLRVMIDGIERLPELICDGILVSTPAGSTAYNLSAHGPILPLSANMLALTPISAFRPRRWRGAILPEIAEIRLEVLEPRKRPVSSTADFTEVRDVCRVDIRQSRKIWRTLLFDPDHTLEERIIKEQFLP